MKNKTIQVRSYWSAHHSLPLLTGHNTAACALLARYAITRGDMHMRHGTFIPGPDWTERAEAHAIDGAGGGRGEQRMLLTLRRDTRVSLPID